MQLPGNRACLLNCLGKVGGGDIVLCWPEESGLMLGVVVSDLGTTVLASDCGFESKLGVRTSGRGGSWSGRCKWVRCTQ